MALAELCIDYAGWASDSGGEVRPLDVPWEFSEILIGEGLLAQTAV